MSTTQSTSAGPGAGTVRRRYAAFISYSRHTDAPLAVALQRALHRLARRWLSTRALRVFRDDSDLAANEGLRTSVRAALDASEFLIVLGSPEAAGSAWVNWEIEYFLGRHPIGAVLLGITAGTVAWDPVAGDFTATSSAVPPALRHRYAEEPRWIDFRGLTGPLTLATPAFRERVADLAAPLHHRDKDDLLGDDVRQRRNAVRRLRATVAGLVVLVVAVAVGAVLAVGQRNEARRQNAIATARGLVDDAEAARGANPRLALQLGVAAYRLDPGAASTASLVQTLTTSDYAGSLPPFAGVVSSVALAPDGRTLAVGAGPTLSLWDIRQPHRPVAIGAPLTGFHAAVSALAWRPDGTMLASADDREMTLWNTTALATPKRVGSLPGFRSPVSAIDWSDDGRRLAVGNPFNAYLLTANDQGFRVASTFDLRADGESGGQPPLSLSGSGTLLVTSGGPASVALWDVTDAEHPTALVRSVPDLPSPAVSTALSTHDDVLAIGTEAAEVVLLDIRTPAKPRQINPQIATGLTDASSQLVFDRDDSAIVVGGRDGTLVRLALPTDQPLATAKDVTPDTNALPLTGHGAPVTAIALRRTDSLLVSGGADGGVLLWNLADDGLTPRHRGAFVGHANGSTRGSLTAAGPLLVSSANDGALLSWDLTRPDQPVTRPVVPFWTADAAPTGDAAPASAITADGQLVVTAVAPPAHGIQLWRSGADGFTGAGAIGGLSDDPRSFAWTTDHHTLVTGDGSGQVTWWDTSDPTRPRLVGSVRHPDAVDHVQLGDHDRILVVTGEDGTASIWDRSDPAHPVRVGTVTTGLIGNVRSADALAADGRTYVVGHSIASFTVWDLSDPGDPRPLSTVLTGLIGPVFSVALSADGSVLAVGGFDSRIQLWDITDPGNPHRFGPDLLGTGIPVLGLAFRAGGTELDSQTITTVDRWDVSMLARVRADAAALACERLGGQGLDPATWRQYASTVDYRATCG